MTEEEWTTQSLCEAWQVRHVAGHLPMSSAVPLPRMVWSLVRNGGYHAGSRELSKQLGSRPRPQVLDEMRDTATVVNAPPGMPPEGPVADVVVHTADMLIPLGRTMEVPRETVVTAFDFVLSRKGRAYRPRGGLDGLRFEATDVDWSAGTGPTVRGDAQHLVAAMYGRPGPVDMLEGDGSGEFRTRF